MPCIIRATRHHTASYSLSSETTKPARPSDASDTRGVARNLRAFPASFADAIVMGLPASGHASARAALPRAVLAPPHRRFNLLDAASPCLVIRTLMFDAAAPRCGPFNAHTETNAGRRQAQALLDCRLLHALHRHRAVTKITTGNR